MGFGEVIVIFIIALLVLGPQRLPTLAKKIGNLTRYLYKSANNLQEEMDNQLKLDELKNNIERAERADAMREAR